MNVRSMPPMRITLAHYRSARATCLRHARIYRAAGERLGLSVEREIMRELRRAIIIGE